MCVDLKLLSWHWKLIIFSGNVFLKFVDVTVKMLPVGMKFSWCVWKLIPRNEHSKCVVRSR